MKNIKNIIQISSVYSEHFGIAITALCADGSVWVKTNDIEGNFIWTCVNQPNICTEE